MRVLNRKSVFRLGLSRVFARASVVGLTGHSAIPREFPYRGLAPTLARCLSTSGGRCGGRLHLRLPAGADRQTKGEPWTIIALPTSHWTHRSCGTRWRSQKRDGTGRRDPLSRRDRQRPGCEREGGAPGGEETRGADVRL